MAGMIKRVWEAIFAEKKAAARRPELAEIAGTERDWNAWAHGDQIIYYDPTVELTGTDQFTEYYEVFREMMVKWPHLRHCLQKRKNAVLARPMIINAAGDTPRDIEVAEFCRGAIKGMKAAQQDLRELLDAIAFGFSVSEIMWVVKERRFVPRELRSRDQARFRFTPEAELLLRESETSQTYHAVPENKFVVHRYNCEHESPYGWGELRYAYWFYFFFKNSLKFWLLFTEKYAAPTVVGKHPPGVSSGEKESLLNALKALQNDQCVRIPETMEVSLLESQRSGSLDSYERFIRYLEMSVSKAILGGTLSSDEGVFGTRAQAEVHDSAREEIVNADCADLSDTIRDQLLGPAVALNYGEGTVVPEITFEQAQNENLLTRAQTDEVLVNIGVPLGKKYFYEAYGRPEPEEGDEVVQAVREQPAALFSEGGRRVGEDWRDEEERYAVNAMDAGREDWLLLQEALVKPFLEAEMEGDVWAVLPDEGIADVERRVFGERLAQAMATGMLNGMAEVDEIAKTAKTTRTAKTRGTGTERFSETKGFAFEPLPPEEAVEWFAGLIPLTRQELEGNVLEVRNHAFWLTDVASRDLVIAVQESLTNAIGNGQTFAGWKAGLGDLLNGMGITRENSFRLETVYRTNVHRAMIKGRDVMTENLVNKGIVKEAEWQSAGDSRVRDDHQRDGRRYPVDDPVWRKMEGFNCRCVKVPVVGR